MSDEAYGMQPEQVDCPACRGAGDIVGIECQACNGDGYLPKVLVDRIMSEIRGERP